MKYFSEIKKSKTFAAELVGLDISSNSIEKWGGEVYSSYLKNKVIVIHKQKNDSSTFAKFGSIFGEPEIHHVRAMRHPMEQTLVMLSNQDEIGRNPVMKYFGDGWHADSSYKEIPANATILLGIEIPEEGGDTLFADATTAFNELPESEKNSLRKLRVRHQYRWSPNRNDPWARWLFVGEQERLDTPEIIHPLVKKHPETQEESLHIAPRIIGSVIGVEGMHESESDKLLDQLMEHITSERYIFKHKWSEGDIVAWDNRAVLHSATTKVLPESSVRRLLRVTTKGRPLIPADDACGGTFVVPDSY